jgi:DNA primase
MHDDQRPSLSVNAKSGLWYCPVCAIGGDGIELWRRVRGLSFADAVKEVAA